MRLSKIPETIDELIKNQNGVILIATPNEIIYEKYLGFADINKKIPVDSNTQFLTGSVTKKFTAVAMLKALSNSNNVEAELRNTIDNYLPEKHPIWNGSMPTWAITITIHQLLVHSSGIPNYTSLPEYEKQKFSNTAELVNFFKSHELEFTPGEKFAYSNSGYFLLGIIIEAITQKKLNVYLEENFFKPLDMQSTFLAMQGTVPNLIQQGFSHLARGYEYELTTHHPVLQEIKSYENMRNPGAAGSLVSTANDLLKWNNALYSGKIIPDSLLKLMLHPYHMTERPDSHYGYGIEIMSSKVLGNYYSHRGGIPGFRSILTYIPSLELSIITLQNIIDNHDKLKPEIDQIQTELSLDLKQEEHVKKLVEIIETKYPAIDGNKKNFEFSFIYEAVIKVLETNG